MPRKKKHNHHFVLPPPDGPTAVGVCKCGEKREFKNYDGDWGGQNWNSSGIKGSGQRKQASPEHREYLRDRDAYHSGASWAVDPGNKDST